MKIGDLVSRIWFTKIVPPMVGIIYGKIFDNDTWFYQVSWFQTGNKVPPNSGGRWQDYELKVINEIR